MAKNGNGKENQDGIAGAHPPSQAASGGLALFAWEGGGGSIKIAPSITNTIVFFQTILAVQGWRKEIQSGGGGGARVNSFI